MQFAGKYLDYGPEDVAAIALGESVDGSMMPQGGDYGDVAGVINMRDPRSQIEGRATGGGGMLNPDVIRAMAPGPARDRLMQRLKAGQEGVSLPGFLQGV